MTLLRRESRSIVRGGLALKHGVILRVAIWTDAAEDCIFHLETGVGTCRFQQFLAVQDTLSNFVSS